MDAPILNWILFLGREVTTQVRSRTTFAVKFDRLIKISLLLRLSSNVTLWRTFDSIWHAQEYKAAWELVKECVPHANVPFDSTSADSLRAFFPLSL